MALKMIKKVKITAIVQARIGSTRLAGKVLLKLEDKAVLELVINRVKQSKLVTEVIVATTTAKEDLAIINLCNSLKIKYFCGSEDDVLDRYYQAAIKFRAGHILRITADCPVIDSKVIDRLIKTYLTGGADYVSTGFDSKFPDGEDAEIFKFQALRKAWQNARLASEREHVTPYIWKNPQLFKITEIDYKINLSDKRWTLDNPEDYEFLKQVYKGLYRKNKFFGIKEILQFLNKNPYLEKINNFIPRNEGYAKSLRQDKIIKKG